jgi:Dimerisation domain
VAKTSWKNWKAPDKRGEQMSAAMVSTHGVMEGEGAATNAQAVPAHVQLIQMATSCWISQIVSTVANLCIADHLAGGPKSASEIAEAVRCNPRALHRFMRALANFGIVKSAGNQKFALTPLGEALKSGAPGAARSTVLMTAGPLVWKCFEQLQSSVETGKTVIEKLFGTPLFDYLAQHPELASQFSEAMVGIHSADLRPSLLRMIFRHWESSLILVARRGTCWRMSLLDIRNAAASCSIVPVLWPTPLLCCVPKEWKAAYALNTEIFSRACQRGAMRTSCRTLSTTGAKSSA